MCGTLESLVATLRSVVAELAPSSLDADEAVELVDLFAEAERLCAAGVALAGERATTLRVWKDSEFRSPGQWLAWRMRGRVIDAVDALETAAAVRALPATREALVRGTLSRVQAASIAAAATADPAAEEALLQTAHTESTRALQERCRNVRAAAAGDETANERIHRGRYCKAWVDRDAAIRLEARLAPAAGAPILARLRLHADGLLAQAKRNRSREPFEAYMADALVELLNGEPPVKTNVHVRVDATALARGRTVPGETCEIEGVPIPVREAWSAAAEGFVKVIERDGVDVRRVAHVGRYNPALTRTALTERDPVCAVPSCHERYGLEIDHVDGYEAGKPTTIDDLDRFCTFHHRQKTRQGYRLVRDEAGTRHWLPPDHPP